MHVTPAVLFRVTVTVNMTVFVTIRYFNKRRASDFVPSKVKKHNINNSFPNQTEKKKKKKNSTSPIRIWKKKKNGRDFPPPLALVNQSVL
jgi:hypothetical protein